MSNSIQYLTLGLDQETFGIDIQHVREILDMGPISALPHAPDFLLGMIDVRGSGYPVVDLRLKLGLPRAEQTAATRIIILDVPVHGRRTGVGFVADRVSRSRASTKANSKPLRKWEAGGNPTTSRGSDARAAASSSSSISTT